MTRHRLPTVTLEQCEQLTGLTRDHAAHTVYTTKAARNRRGYESVPLGLCSGKNTHTMPKPGWTADDPFAGILDED